MRGRAIIVCEVKRTDISKQYMTDTNQSWVKGPIVLNLCLQETSVTFLLSSLFFSFWPTKIVMLIIKIIITANIY